MKRIAIVKVLIVLAMIQPVFVFSEEAYSSDMDEGTAVVHGSENDRIMELESRQEKLFNEIKRLNEIADVRKRLEMTEEEKEGNEKEILSAAGQAYTLLKKGTWGLEYNFSYSYKSSDAILFESIEDVAAATTKVNASVEGYSNHNMTHRFMSELAVADNFTANINIPFVYKYDNGGSGSASDITDIGDVSMGCQWQPFKVNRFVTAPIMNFSLSMPSGTSPYDTSHNNYQSTGSGMYSLLSSVALSKTIDPIIIYGNLGYTLKMIDRVSQNRNTNDVLIKVKPGNDIGFSMGAGYSISYNASFNISTSFSFSQNTDYKWRHTSDTGVITTSTQKSGTSVSGMLNIGCALKYSPRRRLNFTAGFGLTNSAPDFSLALRLPFVF